MNVDIKFLVRMKIDLIIVLPDLLKLKKKRLKHLAVNINSNLCIEKAFLFN